jgi:hypothetical protein
MIVVLLVVPEGESVRPGLLVEVHQHPLLQLILANRRKIRLEESNAKCRYRHKKWTSKGTWRHRCLSV